MVNQILVNTSSIVCSAEVVSHKVLQIFEELSNLHKGDVKSSNRITLSQNVRSRFIQVLVT